MTSGSYPDNVQLIVTERCNLACRHCAVPEEDSPAERELDVAEWMRFVDLLDEQGVRSLTISGGEAMLRGDTLDLVDHACGLRFHQVCLVSNGLVLREADRTRLVLAQRDHAAFGYHVSLDGGTPATHDWMRGAGSWSRTWRNLRRLAASGGRVDGVQVVLHAGNVHEFALVVRQAVHLGARTVVVFPYAAIGRARRNPVSGLTAPVWESVYREAADLAEATGLGVHLMGPVLEDEWPTTSARWPNPATPTSRNMCVGPDGSAFTCPPLRGRSLGLVTDLLTGREVFGDLARRGAEVTADVCGRCKFQLLCTGVDSRNPWRAADSDVVFVDPHVVA